MLSELKDALSGKRTEQLASELAETKKLHNEHSEILSSLKTEINGVKESVEALTEKNQQLLKENTNSLAALTQLKKQLEESINSIKLMSSTIQDGLMRKITDQVSMLTQEISSKLSGSERFKKELEEAASLVKLELNDLKEEIKRLKSVSSNINAADFELVKFSNQLKSADSEKLRLMKEIDTLQRLVSSLRRNSR